GVVPGGGAALLACRPALRRRLKSAADEDERAALRGLLLALEAPARALLANAGFDPSVIGPQLAAGLGCDVRSGAVTDLRAAGVWDSAAVLTAAVHSAVAGAGLALTVETLVQRASPPVASEP
ncbi:MAG: hypothetical protein JNK29_02260, partial [Anaerolineales bacterium]|nr:hypothetical protein [Anaerolineales bacterium]